jgi:arsenate reductase
MMRDTVLHVLFLCTGNSARSIIAEAVLNTLAPDTFRAYSAGSHPKGSVHPYALEVLKRFHYPTDGLHSKSWDVFMGPEAPPVDIVITLCDDAASEPCPLWPGEPVIVHWGLPDPTAVEGTVEAQRMAFVETLRTLRQRLERFTQLPVAAWGRGIQARQHSGMGETSGLPDVRQGGPAVEDGQP